MYKLCLVVTVLFSLACVCYADTQPSDCHSIFFEDFSSYIFDGYFWEAGGTDDGSPRIEDYFDSACVYLDREIGFSERIELTLTLDLAGYENVQIAFDALSRGARITPPTVPFTDGCAADGMAVSLDGTTWYPVRGFDDLPHDMASFVFDLDAAVVAKGLDYTDNFRIRFFVYTGEPWDVDGVLMDNIHVTGFAANNYNYGHAPDPAYPTLLISDGARHRVDDTIMLGATVGTDFDGIYSSSQSPTYRDGVTISSPLVAGTNATIEVTVPVSCQLDSWFDFDGNGIWAGAPERCHTNQVLPAGTSLLSVAVPTNAAIFAQGYARFRVSSAGGLSVTGVAADGEVEDYPITTQCGAPVVDPLPPYTTGGANTISWTSLFPIAVYEVEHSLVSDFSVVEDTSGWSSGFSHEFTGLADEQTHYYRVRAGSMMPGAHTVWRQSRAQQFLTGVLDEVTTCEETGVRLAQPALERNFITDYEELERTQPAFANAGRLNMFRMTQDIVLNEFSMYLRISTPGDIEFVIYEGGASEFDPVTRILSVVHTVAPGEGFYSSGAIALPMQSGIHYYVGVASPNSCDIFWRDADEDIPCADLPCAEFIKRGRYEVYPSPATSVIASNALMRYFTRFTYRTGTDYAAFGSLVSPLITLTPGESWDKLVYTADTPAGTTLALDVLPETGDVAIPGYENLASNADLSALPLNPIRLRAALATTDTAASPVLWDCYVTRRSGADYRLEGPWSATVFSMQSNIGPEVQAITLLDDLVTNAPDVRFQVAFNKDVYNLDMTASFADFFLSGTASGTITSVTGSGNTYTVTVSTGAQEGTLRLDLSAAGPLEDDLNRGLDADYTSGPAYQIEWMRFTIWPPATTTAYLGADYTLEAFATGGAPPLQYQWYKSDDNIAFTPIPGATDANLLLQNVDAQTAGYYYCEAYNAYDSILSPTTQLTVDEHALGGNTMFSSLLLVLLIIVFCYLPFTPQWGTESKQLKEFRKINDENFIGKTIALIDMAIEIGDMKGAIEIQNEALAVLDDDKIRNAISSKTA